MAQERQQSNTQKELLILIMEKQERMFEDLQEVKKVVKELDTRQNDFGLRYTENNAILAKDLSNAQVHISELTKWQRDADKRLDIIEKTLEAQRVMNGVLIFIGSAIGIAAITYIWNIIVN